MFKKLYVIAMFSIALISCSKNKIEMPDGFSYKVNIGKHPINNVVSVDINKRLSLEQLKFLGNEIFETLPKRPKTFIGYLLPGMKDGSGAWAVTNYGDNPEIEIIGTTQDEYLKKQKLTKFLSENSLGAWEGIEPNKFNYLLTDSSGYYLFKMIYSDYVLTDTVNVKQINGETFIYLNKPLGKEHYKINILDQLVYFNEEGNPMQSYQSIK